MRDDLAIKAELLCPVCEKPLAGVDQAINAHLRWHVKRKELEADKVLPMRRQLRGKVNVE